MCIEVKQQYCDQYEVYDFCQQVGYDGIIVVLVLECCIEENCFEDFVVYGDECQIEYEEGGFLVQCGGYLFMQVGLLLFCNIFLMYLDFDVEQYCCGKQV